MLEFLKERERKLKEKERKRKEKKEKKVQNKEHEDENKKSNEVEVKVSDAIKRAEKIAKSRRLENEFIFNTKKVGIPKRKRKSKVNVEEILKKYEKDLGFNVNVDEFNFQSNVKTIKDLEEKTPVFGRREAPKVPKYTLPMKLINHQPVIHDDVLRELRTKLLNKDEESKSVEQFCEKNNDFDIVQKNTGNKNNKSSNFKNFSDTKVVKQKKSKNEKDKKDFSEVNSFNYLLNKKQPRRETYVHQVELNGNELWSEKFIKTRNFFEAYYSEKKEDEENIKSKNLHLEENSHQDIDPTNKVNAKGQKDSKSKAKEKDVEQPSNQPEIKINDEITQSRAIDAKFTKVIKEIPSSNKRERYKRIRHIRADSSFVGDENLELFSNIDDSEEKLNKDFRVKGEVEKNLQVKSELTVDPEEKDLKVEKFKPQQEDVNVEKFIQKDLNKAQFEDEVEVDEQKKVDVQALKEKIRLKRIQVEEIKLRIQKKLDAKKTKQDLVQAENFKENELENPEPQAEKSKENELEKPELQVETPKEDKLEKIKPQENKLQKNDFIFQKNLNDRVHRKIVEQNVRVKYLTGRIDKCNTEERLKRLREEVDKLLGKEFDEKVNNQSSYYQEIQAIKRNINDKLRKLRQSSKSKRANSKRK